MSTKQEVVVMEVPKGCVERSAFIYDMSFQLAERFRYGNKSAVFEQLKQLPFAVAMAVVARMVKEEPELGVAEYLNEVA